MPEVDYSVNYQNQSKDYKKKYSKEEYQQGKQESAGNRRDGQAGGIDMGMFNFKQVMDDFYKGGGEDESDAEAAARQVVTNVSDVSSGSADNTEPPLKPNQPSQRINTPAVAIGIL